MAQGYRPSDPGLVQSPAPLDRSYRALLKVPAIVPLLLGMQIARIGQSMVSVTIVLFTLASYRSPTLAGLATFFAIFPGLVVSPIAGALLERHGRVRLVVLDYLVALGSLTLMGILALTGALPAWLLMVIAAIASLTTPLSATGLRGLGFAISLVNLAGGTFTIVVPLLILERFHLNETVVGLVFAVQGLTGVISAIVCGRIDSRNRERIMLAVPMIASAVTIAVLLLESNIVVLVLVMGLTGFLNGPLDVALFTLCQRRTDPAWTGRAFAVSMSFNYLGIPVGSALAGIIAARSIEWAVAFGAVACLVAGVVAVALIPSSE